MQSAIAIVFAPSAISFSRTGRSLEPGMSVNTTVFAPGHPLWVAEDSTVFRSNGPGDTTRPASRQQN